MKKLTLSILMVAVGLTLSGCGKLFGGNDNTILPGTREDAIPGHASFPEPGDTGGVADGTATAQQTPPDPSQPAPPVDCTKEENKDDPACAPPSSDGTFSDGQ